MNILLLFISIHVIPGNIRCSAQQINISANWLMFCSSDKYDFDPINKDRKLDICLFAYSAGSLSMYIDDFVQYNTFLTRMRSTVNKFIHLPSLERNHVSITMYPIFMAVIMNSSRRDSTQSHERICIPVHRFTHGITQNRSKAKYQANNKPIQWRRVIMRRTLNHSRCLFVVAA